MSLVLLSERWLFQSLLRPWWVPCLLRPIILRDVLTLNMHLEIQQASWIVPEAPFAGETFFYVFVVLY